MYFLKHKTFTYFLLILSILVGTYMMSSTPKELYPEIKIPVVVVSTVYPGASAKDIEEMTTEDGMLTADCQFCGSHYEFDPKTLGFEAEK